MDAKTARDVRRLAHRPAIKTVAVIDIGATSIRMAIGEIDESGSVRTLDTLSQAVSLGKDTFSDNVIRKSTMEECVRVLRAYRHIVEQYRIKIPDNVRVVATSAVREARNRLAFIDRVYIATGLVIDPIDEAEVNRVTYLGVAALSCATNRRWHTPGRWSWRWGEAAPSCCWWPTATSSPPTRFGSARCGCGKALEAYNAPAAKIQRVMASQIQRMVDEVREQVVGDGPLEMIALGGDVRFAAAQLLQDWHPDQLTRLPVAALEDFTSQLIALVGRPDRAPPPLEFSGSGDGGAGAVELRDVRAGLRPGPRVDHQHQLARRLAARDGGQASRGRRSFASRSSARRMNLGQQVRLRRGPRQPRRAAGQPLVRAIAVGTPAGFAARSAACTSPRCCTKSAPLSAIGACTSTPCT